MTKSETVRSLSAEQTAPRRQQLRSEIELQNELASLIEGLALNLTDLSEENRATAKAVLRQITKTATTAEKAITVSQKKATGEIDSLLGTARTITKQASTAAGKIERQARAIRWAVVSWIGASGLALGALLLTVLLIWQPALIVKLYRVAEALGTVAP